MRIVHIRVKKSAQPVKYKQSEFIELNGTKSDERLIRVIIFDG